MSGRASGGSSVPPAPRARGRRPGLRIASGGSPLARARTETAVGALARAPEPVPAAVVTVAPGPVPGQSADPDARGGCSDLVRAARQALLTGRADACVHSLSDVPVDDDASVVLGAVLPRSDARDALVASAGRRLADLPAGARVGAGSTRGASLLRAVRPDLATAETACGVDAAVGLVAQGRYDAVLTALGGLALLGLAGEATQVFDASEFVPAPAQGAIGIECRADDARTLALLSPLDHAPTRAAVAAERGVLEALGRTAGRRVGAHATVDAGLVSLRAMLPGAAGALPLVGDAVGPAADAARVGRDLGRQLLEARGARPPRDGS